jgi:hypothetical protein
VRSSKYYCPFTGESLRFPYLNTRAPWTAPQRPCSCRGNNFPDETFRALVNVFVRAANAVRHHSSPLWRRQALQLKFIFFSIFLSARIQFQPPSYQMSLTPKKLKLVHLPLLELLDASTNDVDSVVSSPRSTPHCRNFTQLPLPPTALQCQSLARTHGVPDSFDSGQS